MSFGDFCSLEGNIDDTLPLLPNSYLPQRIISHSQCYISSTSKEKESNDVILESASIADIDEKSASAALKGFIPFSDDHEKQERYLRYLRQCSRGKIAGDSLSSIQTTYLDESERQEFISSAQIFRPSSSIIASRFKTSSHTGLQNTKISPGLSRPSPKTISDTNIKIESAEHGTLSSYASTVLTRTSLLWVPCSLLFKRFNINPPTTSFSISHEQPIVKPKLTEDSIDIFLNSILADSNNRSGSSESFYRQTGLESESNISIPSEDFFLEIFGTD